MKEFNLRKYIASILLKPERERLIALTKDAVNDYRMIPYLRSRETGDLLDQLGELDPRLADVFLRTLRNYSDGADSSEAFRIAVVKESRALYLSDPLTQFSIELWTDYAFDESPKIVAGDPGGQEIWNEFFRADRNNPILGDRFLHTRSEDLLTDGELFFVIFASRVDGMSTVRIIPTEEIKELLTDPEDSSVVLYYRRDYNGAGGPSSMYYRDWRATEDQLARAKLPAGAEIADKKSEATDVSILHGAFREIKKRGWPLATTAIDWTREYKKFLQNRSAVAAAAASVVEKIKVKGGQRAIDMIRGRLGTSLAGSGDSMETNPPPAPGSTWLENEALSREWMNRPTNSGDAEKDGSALKKQAGLGYKLYPHFLGDGDYYRLATATAMEGPTLKSFNRYQAFWASIWKDMYKIVIGFAEKYGSLSLSTHEAKVSQNRILTLSPEEISASMTLLMDLFDRGLIDGKIAGEIGNELILASLDIMGVEGMEDTLAKSAEVSESGALPFAESGESDYSLAIRRAFYALWSGKLDKAGFVDQMEASIDLGLRRAWKEGIESVGLSLEDMTSAEELALGEAVLDQYNYISGVADFIDSQSKANGGKLESIQYRAALWGNKYKQIQSRARLMASNDPPLTWNEGPTKEKCDDCIYADGKTYRASVWARWGWETQSDDLECHGYECKCSLDPAAPGTRLNRGHPRRPHG